MGQVLQKSLGIRTWHPNEEPLGGEGAGGAAHSPISARSCSATLTRRGWGGKAQAELSTGLPSQGSVGRVPCAPPPSPHGELCSTEVGAGHLPQRAPSTHPSTLCSTQHPAHPSTQSSSQHPIHAPLEQPNGILLPPMQQHKGEGLKPCPPPRAPLSRAAPVVQCLLQPPAPTQRHQQQQQRGASAKTALRASLCKGHAGARRVSGRSPAGTRDPVLAPG